MQEQAAATGMAVGTVSQLDTALLAIPPPAPFSGTAQPLGAAVSADPPVAPVAPEGMSDEDIALIGVALGLGVLVLLVGVIAALLTIRHHFVHLEEQRRQGAERDKGPHASWQRHGSKVRPLPPRELCRCEVELCRCEAERPWGRHAHA